MKYTIYSFFLLLSLMLNTQRLQAQCAVEAQVNSILTCNTTQVTLTANANVPNALYSWTGPNSFASIQQNPVVNMPGNYSVTITDPGDGCTATSEVLVAADFALPTVSTVGGTLTCFSPIITLSSTTNAPNPVFFWSGPGGFTSTVQNPAVTSPGQYTVIVTNTANGCTATASAVVTQNMTVPDVSTTGGVLGCSSPTVPLSASSNTMGVTFSWIGPGGFTSTIQNPVVTSIGTYTVVVTIANGCTSTQSVEVTLGSDVPQVSTVVTSPSCLGPNNGSISITPTGGTPPYTFSWWGPNTYTSALQNITNLAAGTYTLTLSDATGCSSVRSINVTQPAPIVIIPTVTSTICYDGNTGTILVGTIGGTPPYTYLWTNGSTNNSIQNLPAGTYIVTVTDANGCTAATESVVSQPSPIILTSIICDNSITAVTSGGVAPYHYLWAGGATAPTITSVPPGTYTVTVVDVVGCSASSDITLSPGNNPPCTNIHGRIVFDESGDCVPEVPETGIGGWYVKAEGQNGIFYGVTDSAGYYDIRLLPGIYTVFPVSLLPTYGICSPTIGVPIQEGESITVDFVAQGANPDCPAMTVDLSTGVLRRCFSNNYYNLYYCNNSLAEVPDAYILLNLDPLLSIVSSPRPYTALGNNIYRFDLGVVAPFECSQFNVQINVSCDAILGQTHCSEAHIFPDAPCDTPNPLWSGAEVSVHSECASDSLHFTLKNIGSGPMTNPLNYIVIEDGIMGLQGNAPPLAAGDSMIVSVPANGSTWRIEAEQVDYFPGLSVPTLSIEGCATASSFSTGYVQQFATNDADPFIDVDCTANIGSYDPNDKQGFPLGYGAAHYILPGTDIEYLIRFQNTGTDTAFNVVVRDTLPSWLDPTTVVPGGSSHNYRFDITGNGILIFDFQNILLPDSNVNETASHGFLKFRVSQRSNVPLETDILNSAAIYFDFNDPIITNTTVHRVGKQFLPTVGLWQPERPNYHVEIAPHPLRDASWLKVQGVPEQGNYRLRLYDATGRPVQEMNSASPQFRVEKAALPSGMYMFRVEMDGILVGRGTLIAQ